ncbi:MAG: hypothetical protein GY906_23835 [bacterium]|nr:hypothetical protein [bacterium]
MAHFYGTLHGNRGEASRCGSKGSGMVTCCAAWGGAIRSYAWVNSEGVDMVRVEKVQWQGVGETRLLYEGPIGHTEGLPEQFGRPEEEEADPKLYEKRDGSWWLKGRPVGPVRGPYATLAYAKEARKVEEARLDSKKRRATQCRK